jgi:hypothetical protein
MWTECSAILGEDVNISLMNFSKVVARKGNIMDMMKKTQDQISLLQEWAKKVETGPVNRMAAQPSAQILTPSTCYT